MMEDKSIRFRYVNWRGEESVRWVVPLSISFEATEWHPEPQWLLHADDLVKFERRSFALRDIKEWLTGAVTGKDPEA